MNKFDVIVIGGGPTAITLAKSLKRKKTLGVIRPEDHSMIYCAMPYAIEGVLLAEKTLKPDTHVTDEGGIIIRDSVKSVDFNEKVVYTQKGESYSYEELVIASGADPILPPIEGSQLDGVMTFKTEIDLKRIIELVQIGLREAVVVGAGAIGIELAQALHKVGAKTHLIDMFPTILPNMMDEELIQPVQAELESSGVHLHMNQKVSKLLGKEHVERLEFESGESITFSTKPLVVFAVGMRASIDFLKDSPLEIGRTGILVDNHMRTNLPGVYAAGDCCEFSSAITGDVILGKLATNAVPMGRVLGQNLAGGNRAYPGFYNGAATKVLQYFVGSTGLSEKLAQTKGYDYAVGKVKFTTAFPIMPFTKDITVKLLVDKKTRLVLGGQVVSGEPVTDKVDQITMAIQFGVTVDQLAQFSYSSQPYQSYFPANNLLVQAAESILAQLG